MKKMLLGLALCGLTFACASENKASVEDAGPAVCTECEAGTCTECPAAGECSGAKKEECSGSAEQKVCPVTGKVMN
jgi:hypothetical protein